MIVLENVVKEYPNGVGAINGISLHIERGEFVFVVGDSGSGKSTLIKLLLKELEPTSGTIRVNGVNLGRMKKRAIPKYRRKIGCVFQDFRLLKDRNVYENVAFAQRVVVTPIKEIKKNVPAMLSLVGLAEKYKSFPRQLSGGEQQRVALARALVNSPDILLADEPTSALDVTTQAQIVRQMMELRDDYGTGIIVVTHNLGVAAYMSDYIVVMKDGRIEDQGDRDHILHHSENEYTRKLLSAVPSMGGKSYV